MQSPAGEVGDEEEGPPMMWQLRKVVIAGRETATAKFRPKNSFCARKMEGRISQNPMDFPDFSIGNGCQSFMDDRGNVFGLENRSLSHFLGFLEPETSPTEISPEIDVFPASVHYQGIVRAPSMAEMSYLRRRMSLIIEEFLKLANRVIDGDETAMNALKNLQIRWETKFGKCSSKSEVAPGETPSTQALSFCRDIATIRPEKKRRRRSTADLVEYIDDVINDVSPDDVTHDGSPNDVTHDVSPNDVSHDVSPDVVRCDASMV
ncbi:UNVERIFIED_CONTAM: hypothetical protein Sindi_1263200 [Sesamum indicum]